MRKFAWKDLEKIFDRLLGTYTFTSLYTIFSAILFALFYFNWMPDSMANLFYYFVTDLWSDPRAVLISISMSPLLNDTPSHLLFVLGLLAAFGVWFERKEGFERTVFVFYFANVATALLAGYLLNGLHLVFVGRSWAEEAWVWGWAGGSVGMYGLAGAVAARVRRGWLILFAMLALEGLAFNTQDVAYVAAFHLIGLAIGYLTSRYIIREKH